MSSYYINLVKEMTIADFKLRYRGSILGILWSLIKPLSIFGVFYFVFSEILQVRVKDYALYLLLGIFIWSYFAETSSSSLNNLTKKYALIKKLNFPKTTIIASTANNSLIGLFLNMLVFAFLVVVSGITVSFTSIVFLVFIVHLYLISAGVSLLLSAINVKYRDIKHIWEVALRIGFWLTPIIYSIDMIPKKYRSVVMLNPLAQIIDYSRKAILGSEIVSTKQILFLTIISIIIFLVGYITFTRKEDTFAENI